MAWDLERVRRAQKQRQQSRINIQVGIVVTQPRPKESQELEEAGRGPSQPPEECGPVISDWPPAP